MFTQNKSQSSVRKSVLLGMALLSLSACGKSMRIGASRLTTPGAPPAVAEVKVPAVAGKDMTGLMEKLTPLSLFDSEKKYAGNNPFLNASSPEGDRTRMIGYPVFKTSDTPSLGYLKATNVNFRAVLQIPDPKNVKTSEAFGLTLKLHGLRKYVKDASDNTLKDQLICVLQSHTCSGDDPAKNTSKDVVANMNPKFWTDTKVPGKVVNNVFSQIPVKKVVATLSDGSFLMGRDGELDDGTKDLELDLVTLFSIYDVNDKSLTGDQKLALLMDWISKNSKPYSKNGYVKFKFSLGNNTYLDQSDYSYLHFSYTAVTTATGDASAPDVLVNGPDDGVEAKYASAATTPDAKPAAVDTKQAAPGANTTPAGANTTSAGANTTSAGANTTPAGANNIPAGANTTSAGANTTSAGANTTPAGANNIPAGANAAPAGANAAPAGANTTPAGANNTPAGANNTPAGANTTPAGANNATTGPEIDLHHGYTIDTSNTITYTLKGKVATLSKASLDLINKIADHIKGNSAAIKRVSVETWTDGAAGDASEETPLYNALKKALMDRGMSGEVGNSSSKSTKADKDGEVAFYIFTSAQTPAAASRATVDGLMSLAKGISSKFDVHAFSPAPANK